MPALTIQARDILIAVEDSGRQKSPTPPILLLHGFGTSLLDWSLVTPYLVPTHRVISMDLRNHGLSGSGAWDWRAVLDDINSVLKQLQAENAVIAGHSLGGIIAGMYAKAYPQTTGCINFDGFGRGRAENYIGIDPQMATKHLRRIRAIEAAHAGTRMSYSDVASMVQHAVRGAAQLQIAADLLASGVRRRLQVHNDGTFTHRPDKAQLLAVYDSLEDVDVFAIFSSLTSPSVIVRATRTHPDEIHVPAWAAVQNAYAAGLHQALSRLSAPAVSVCYVDATHQLLFEIPKQVANIIASVGG
jgi:pimeloyl-ACP methyl ester carboxylesterase